jgi:hypothetical protein
MSLITTRKLIEIAEICWLIYDFSYYPAIVWFWGGKKTSVLQKLSHRSNKAFLVHDVERQKEMVIK